MKNYFVWRNICFVFILSLISLNYYHLYFRISAIQQKICIIIHSHTAYFLHICGFYAKSSTEKETNSHKE